MNFDATQIDIGKIGPDHCQRSDERTTSERQRSRIAVIVCGYR